jgi:hypothetical protein
MERMLTERRSREKTYKFKAASRDGNVERTEAIL